MAQGDIVENGGELPAFDVVLVGLVDVGVFLGVVRRSAGEEVAGGEDGRIWIFTQGHGGLRHFAVVPADALPQAEQSLFGGFPELRPADVPLPEVGHGGDDQARSAVAGGRGNLDNLLLHLRPRRPHHVQVQPAQDFPRSVQHRRRVMVAPHDHRRPALRAGQLSQELVVQLPRLIGRVRYVENVAGDDEYVHLLLLDRIQQPGQGRTVLGRPVAVVKAMAKVPVCGVKNAQGEKGSEEEKGKFGLVAEGRKRSLYSSSSPGYSPGTYVVILRSQSVRGWCFPGNRRDNRPGEWPACLRHHRRTHRFPP